MSVAAKMASWAPLLLIYTLGHMYIRGLMRMMIDWRKHAWDPGPPRNTCTCHSHSRSLPSSPLGGRARRVRETGRYSEPKPNPNHHLEKLRVVSWDVLFLNTQTIRLAYLFVHDFSRRFSLSVFRQTPFKGSAILWKMASCVSWLVLVSTVSIRFVYLYFLSLFPLLPGAVLLIRNWISVIANKGVGL